MPMNGIGLSQPMTLNIFSAKNNMDKITKGLTWGGRGLFKPGICFATLPVPGGHSIPDTATSLFIVRN